MKKRIYEYPPMLFEYFSKVGYFPDKNNHIIESKKTKKVKGNAENIH
ncbi:MAG: hypothetical protein QW272_09745 [Candidatus Methanomethylicaceae archaeon]